MEGREERMDGIEEVLAEEDGIVTEEHLVEDIEKVLVYYNLEWEEPLVSHPSPV